MKSLLVVGLMALLGMVCMLAPGCDSSKVGSSSMAMPAGNPAPAPAELEALLAAELARLGVDPAKTAATAPQGYANGPFDLTPRVIDPDGLGPVAPTAVLLRWTERCIGDYNQDGLVGVSDLTPLGQRYLESVAYGDKEYRNGYSYWPMGNPTDDGGAGSGHPPLPGSPADNWRLARIDGNGDGLINVSDITPIGQHWGERLDGYRVYRMVQGESDYTLLPNPDNPGMPYTVTRALGFLGGAKSADPHRPVVYEFEDRALSNAHGFCYYYVIPYDAQSGEEGQFSPWVAADLNGGGAGDSPPTAALKADIEMGDSPLTVNFSSAQSWDADGEIVACEWDTDGDASTWEIDSFPGMTRQVVYHTAATHHQWVRITDDDGNVATACAKVSVREPGGNQPPVATVSAEPSQGEAPLEVTWNAALSADHDGTIVKYEWDTDNDPSTFEFNTGATPVYLRTYPSSGSFKQYVRVTDDGGMTDTGFAVVIVNGDSAPVAVFTTDVSEGDVPVMVNFDASGSYDTTGTIQLYEWDYNGDSVVDDALTVPTTSHNYITPGDYWVSLKVTNDQGVEATAYANIVVHGWLNILVDAGPKIGADVSLALISGRPAIAYSLNDYGNDMELRYIRAFDATGRTWPASPVIVDDGGALRHVGTSVSLAAVNNRPAIGYHDATDVYMLYRRASDTEGAAWPPYKCYVYNNSGDYCSLAVVDGQPALSFLKVTDDQLYYVRANDQDGTYWPLPVAVNTTGGTGRFTRLVEGFTPAAVPMIAHYSRSSPQLLFECANDADGTSWRPPVGISDPGDCINSSALAIIDGLPALAYYGKNQLAVTGLHYIRATDSTLAWGPLIEINAGAENGMRPCLATIGAVPAIAYKVKPKLMTDKVMYRKANDAAGSTWDAYEYVDYTRTAGPNLSLIEVAGQPAIAYTDDAAGQLWYAIRI